MSNPDHYIGLMSGTSLDGVDAVLLKFSGSAHQIIGESFTPFDDSLRTKLLALHKPQSDEIHEAAVIGNELAHIYAQAVRELLGKSHTSSAKVQAIGCHGQTIRHRPDAGYTIQLGNGALLAELTRNIVVCDFRSRDIAAGGEGAPLVPAFHQAIFSHPTIHRVIVNIGGIANLTDLGSGARARRTHKPLPSRGRCRVLRSLQLELWEVPQQVATLIPNWQRRRRICRVLSPRYRTN